MTKPIKTIKVKKANKEAKVEEPVKTSKVSKSSKVEKEESKVDDKKKKGSTKIPIQVKEEPKSKEKDSKKKSKKDETSNTIQVEREVKYAYPDDVQDSMSRKKFRHECRAKKQSFENALSKIKDKKSKEFLAKDKEYKAFLTVIFK